MSHKIVLDPDVTTTHDETAGLQNATATPAPPGDADDNDIAVASLPSEFSTRLTTLGADPSGAIGAALSGYDGANNGLDILTVEGATGTISNLALVGPDGNPLNGLDSGLTTVDGTTIFLYSDPTDDNIVVGREGDGTGTADPTGNIVLALYLEASNPDNTAAKMWTVQYQPTISHPDATDPDDSVDLFDKIFAAATQELEFDASNSPSGQNLFIMFGDGTITDGVQEVAVVATGKNPANESEEGVSINDGDTVNTSQAGGPTTFGVDNQMINEGEGLYYTFVTGPNPDFTVPNLSQTEADVEANIQFVALQASRGASFDVVQLQSGKTAVVTISAWANNDADPSGVNFVDAFANDIQVDIASVEVVDFDGGGEIVVTDNGDGTFTISGVEADDEIQYLTSVDHNRILIENTGDGRGQDSADFDIGGFTLLEVTEETADVGDKVSFEDDGPAIDIDLSGAILSTDDRSLTGGSGLPDAGTNTDTDTLTTFVTNNPGNDGQKSLVYTLGVKSAGEDSGVDDVATGNSIFLYLESGVVVGRVGTDETTADPAGDTAFTVSVNSSTGAVTLDQSRAIEHGTPETNAGAPDYYTTDVESLIADTVTLTATLTDGDDDFASDFVNIGDKLSFTDDGPQVDIDLSGAILSTDDRSLTGGSGLPDAGTNTDTDALTTVVTNTPGADGDALEYTLGVKSAGEDSGVDDVATGNSIFLYLESGVVVGRVGTDETTADPTGDVAFTVSVDAGTGAVTLTQSLAIEHDTAETNAGAPDYYTTDVENLIADTVTLTATLTDRDLDVATDTVNIGDKLSFTDDGPQVDIELSGAILSTDDRSLTGGSGLPDAGTNTDTDALTTVVTNTPGADGDALEYTLGVKSAGEDSGVDDVATGNSIFLYLESGVVVGRVGTDETTADPTGDVAFTVSVDAGTGAVTLTQSLAIEHDTAETNAGAPDYYTTDVENLIADTVTLTATLTDRDLDVATDTVNIGDKLSFTDDGPQVDIELSGAILSTDDRSLTGGSGLPDAGTNTDTDALTTVVTNTPGADGDALVYSLGVKSAGEDSGVDDVATGFSIFLYKEGDDVVGRVGTDDVTPNPAGDVAFTVSVDAGTGAVTLTQSLAIEHGMAETNAGAPDYYTTDVENLIADTVTLTATLTDRDLDVATDTVNIGDKLSFTDDGPQVDIDLSGTVLSTDDRSLTGGSGLPDAGTNTDTDALTTVVTNTPGADGDALVYSLGVKSAGEDSGVDDVATGFSIFLYKEGDDVVGRVGTDDVTPNPAGDVAFTVSVDAGTGAVTLTQSLAIEHGMAETNAGAPDYYTTDVENLIADTVTLTATLTDRDLDVATDTVNIGDKLSFTDDGPQVDIELSGTVLSTDDRSLTGGSGLPDAGTNTDTGALTTVVTNTPGADGDALEYTLGVKSAGEDSGVDDVATGNSIFLYLESGVVVGRVGTDETTADPTGAIAFEVSVDSTTGAVTSTQSRAIEHGVAETNAGSPDYYTTDVENLIADTVTLTATLTDGDLDVATDTVNIGDKLSFTDDGPQVDIDLSGTVLSTDDRSLTGGSGLPDAGTNTDTGALTTAVTNTPGADGDALVYSLGVKSAGEDSGVDDVATGFSIFLYKEGDDVVGRVGTDDVTPNPAGDVAFTVSVDAGTGAVTLTQSLAIEHGMAETNAGAPDYYTTDVENLIADTVTLTATLTDRDLDVATDTVNIGDKLSFTDDGPQVDIDLSGTVLSTDDRSLTGGSGLPDAGTNTDTGALTTAVTNTPGADGDALVYSLGVKSAGEDSGVDDVATGFSIFLYKEGDDVVGRVGTDDVTPNPAGDVAFTVSVDAGTGAVTLTQSLAIEHGMAETNAGSPDYYTTDVENLIADTVTLTATLTDRDLDVATDTVNIGDKLSFTDDGPQVDIDLSGTVLSTDDRSLTGGSGLPDAGTNTDTDALTTVVTNTPGADGDALVYSLGVKSAGEDSGVDDVATGFSIFLYKEGDDVVGRVGTDDVTPNPAGDVAFTVSVDAGTGAVTLTQSLAIEHGMAETNAGSPDYYTTDVENLIADTVTLTATLTDRDLDVATDTVNIGDKLSFTDDGPQVDIDLSGTVLSTDDRSLTGGSGLPDAGTNTDTGALTTAVTNTPGADGDALVYSLGVKSAGEDSGVDDAFTGNSIFLYLESGVVVGRVGTDETTADPTGAIAFEVSVDSTTGAVTSTQSRAIEHGVAETNAGSPDYYTTDVENLIADTVTLTATLTDGDLDVATDTVNIGDKIGFTDDGPDVAFDDLIGTVTTAVQSSTWTQTTGADRPVSLAVAAVDSDLTVEGINFDMRTADGIESTGIIAFAFNGTLGLGTGTLTADFDNDPVTADQTIGFSLTVNQDDTYDFQLDEVIVPVVVLSTDEGQLPAGGPDPVQTLTFGLEPDTTDFVFFAVDADTATSGGIFDPSNIGGTPPDFTDSAIGFGEPDLTEAQLEAGAAPPIGDNTFPFIREEIEMNVSTTGIGVGNNVFQGYDPNGGTDGAIDPFNPDDLPNFDESFVINPEPLASSVKVFISKTAGGFLPPVEDGIPQEGETAAKTDYLYWNLYDELGNNSGPNLVLFGDIVDEKTAPGGTGENLWSFAVDIDDVDIDGDFIDAMQFTMGFGDIKVPKIEVVARGDEPPNDIFLDFEDTLTDADGDAATDAFAIDLFGDTLIA